MLNPKVLLKCHEDLITLDTYVQIHMYNKEKQWIIILFLHICKNINIFGYMEAREGGGGGASIRPNKIICLFPVP